MNQFVLKQFLISIAIVFIFNFSLFADINTKERINVAFCIDNNYPLYTMLLINSILLNNESKSEYMFYVVNNDLSLWNKIRMKLYVTLRGQKIEFIKVDTDDIDGGKNLFDSNEITKHVSRIGTARILLPELLTKEVEKVLYLDSDMLVLSDLKELYDIHLDNYYAGMVLDISAFDEDGDIVDENATYYNSGMILMDLSLWRQNNISYKMIKYIQNNNNLKYVDQDAINAILKNKVKKLQFKYNNFTFCEFAILETDDSCIVHYITSTKPWNTYKQYACYDIYYDYWGRSGLLFEKILCVSRYYLYDKFVPFVKEKYKEIDFKNIDFNKVKKAVLNVFNRRGNR